MFSHAIFGSHTPTWAIALAVALGLFSVVAMVFARFVQGSWALWTRVASIAAMAILLIALVPKAMCLPAIGAWSVLEGVVLLLCGLLRPDARNDLDHPASGICSVVCGIVLLVVNMCPGVVLLFAAIIWYAVPRWIRRVTRPAEQRLLRY